MTLVSPPQVKVDDEITAASVNDPVNAIATVVNGGLDDTNVSALSGSKISSGTIPVAAATTDANVETRLSETGSNFIVPGGLVLSTISGLNVALTAGVVYIGGKRIVVAAVASTALTASKDTYVSVDNTGVVSFASTVANNASSPSLPANSLWIGLIITNGSTSTLINQGQTAINNAVLPPTISSNTLWKFDTNGNPLYPVSSVQSLKVYQQRVANASTGGSGSNVAYNGFPGTYNFIAVAGRTYTVSIHEPNVTVSASTPATTLILPAIAGTAIGAITTPFGSITTQHGIDGELEWKATTTGTVALTVLFRSVSGGTFSLNANNTDQSAILKVVERS